jgi:hypothetical protein
MDKKENPLIPIFQKMLLLEEENINKSQIIDTNRIFCDLCLHDYRIDNYKKHLKSKKHLKKIA